MGLFDFFKSEDRNEKINESIFLEECHLYCLTEEEIEESRKAVITAEEYFGKDGKEED